ncbi:hypothetical protein [Paenibacillus nasutitermitis]|uniref:Uncharacterized protein n=1 Tax=Paenibacillus nasutitermitis TaxID=1652958 RepID=A0A916ZF93_9BACL|nr:hypothetical protein [Paenibacillus nasutitermitis]GGD93862.1 hypothetical protein GCM10010911_60670 [Paenibacillus nasutitermitis]
MAIYVRDNFFSTGITEMMNEKGEKLGELDLKSAFGSSLDIYDAGGRRMYGGKFRFFSNKWEVTQGHDSLVGVLRVRMSFLSKRFEYEAEGRGTYEITSPAFSKEYSIQRIDTQEQVASFERTSGWLHSGAYCLENHSDDLNDYELAAVVMGVQAIRRRQSASAGGSA